MSIVLYEKLRKCNPFSLSLTASPIFNTQLTIKSALKRTDVE